MRRRLLLDLQAMGKSRKNFYAVRVGRSNGVFRTWEECEAHVKQYPRAVFKGFSSRAEADSFVGGGGTSSGATSRPSYSSHVRQTYSRGLPYHNSKPTANDYTYSGGSGSSSCASTFSSRPSYLSQRSYSSSVPHHTSRTYSSSSDSHVAVYSDGCCYKNGYRGAQAGIGVYWGEGSSNNLSEKLEGHQTNQRAELVSACRALESAIGQGLKSVEVKTDSMYTIRAMTEWVGKWKRNGWQTVNCEEVKNKEDIQRLDNLCQQIDVKWTHVPGHKGVLGNEAADKLAKAGSQK